MFINCRHCDALVATNPATDEPPEHCPRCGGTLREAIAPAIGTEASSVDAAPIDTASDDDVRADDIADTAARDTGVLEADAPVAGDDPAGAWRRAAELVAVLSARDERRAETLASQDGSGDPDSDAAPAHASARTMDVAPADTDAPEDAAAPPRAADEADDPLHARGDDADDAVGTDATPATSTVTATAATATASEASPTPANPRTAPATAGSQKSAPSFVAARQRAPAAPARHRWGVPAAVAALSSLLLLQILLADRARLSADARWRPLLSSLCGVLGCSLPPWREPAAFRLVARDVRAHPQRPGVLRATATFRNDARWAQAWPRVVLTLSDVEGRTIGRRDFAPAEYLGETPTENALSSGQSAMILLDVVEPAANVVAFSFEFR